MSNDITNQRGGFGRLARLKEHDRELLLDVDDVRVSRTERVELQGKGSSHHSDSLGGVFHRDDRCRPVEGVRPARVLRRDHGKHLSHRLSGERNGFSGSPGHVTDEVSAMQLKLGRQLIGIGATTSREALRFAHGCDGAVDIATTPLEGPERLDLTDAQRVGLGRPRRPPPRPRSTATRREPDC